MEEVPPSAEDDGSEAVGIIAGDAATCGASAGCASGVCGGAAGNGASPACNAAGAACNGEVACSATGIAAPDVG